MVDSLVIYKKALGLTRQIYLITKNNRELAKDFSLCDQVKRAAVSVAANISEGYLRTIKYSISYLKIASGSANEVITLLEIVQLVYEINTVALQREYNILVRQISAFANRLSS